MSTIDDEWQLINGVYRKVERDEDAVERKELTEVYQWFYQSCGAISMPCDDVIVTEQENGQD